jgi:hypothetical protein
MFCVPLVPPLIGILLGVLGIIESGAKGSRSGRGMAIAGTIVSVISIALFVVAMAVMVYAVDRGVEQFEEAVAAGLEEDQQLILARLKAYYDANEQSLGPGGPVLARQNTTGYDGTYRTQPTNAPAPANQPPAVDTRPRVAGALTLRDLVGEHELAFGSGGGGGMGWELTISGKASATLRARDWNSNVVREVDIRDIGRNQIIQVK